MEKPYAEINDLRRIFDISKPWLNRVLEGSGKQFLKAVDGVSFDIARGETFALVGESGSGKSTVARMVVGLLPPSGGDVTIDGVPMVGRASAYDRQRLRRRIQMIFQDPYASLNPRWKVEDIVAEPIRAFRLLDSDKATSERVGELLSLVGLHPADGIKFPHEFSGGQRQRVAIARALASNAEFIVCDEPTSALDVSVQAQILNLMRDLQDQFGLTYLFISHNLAVVRHMATRIGVMYLGRIVEISGGRELFAAPKHPYTRMLLDAVPDMNMAGEERIPISGEIPNPINPPSGCTFNPRCPFANDRCRCFSTAWPVMRFTRGASPPLRRPDSYRGEPATATSLPATGVSAEASLTSFRHSEAICKSMPGHL
jgi:peptide/nickel transport system ATP-binding protein